MTVDSEEPQPFADRWEAGRILGERVAAHLAPVSDAQPLVLGLPRGGIPVAVAVAHAVHGELDIVVARKIGFPGQPEFGVGAVTATGRPVFDADTLRQAGLHEQALSREVDAERAEACRRQRRYRGDRPPPVPRDRLVVVVDDGLATGVTARAALRAVRVQQPAYLMFAAPVCAVESSQAIAAEVDAVVCARVPKRFRAVGAWYDEFAQLSDEVVEQILHREWGAGSVRPGTPGARP